MNCVMFICCININICTNINVCFSAERADEKLHRRTTVRMGIRVVQRAYAPPSPHMYVPGGGARTNKVNNEKHYNLIITNYMVCHKSPI